jgi:hypothetical protein
LLETELLAAALSLMAGFPTPELGCGKNGEGMEGGIVKE